MKSSDFVTEAFDQPYPVEWDKDDFGDLHALAFLDDGSPLEIKFVQESGGQWHIVFDRNYSLRVTGEGDQQRVFATVLAAVKEFVKKRKPQKIIFSATKDVDPGQKSNSRASLYNSLVNRYAAALGYTAHIDDRGDQVVYELMRAQKPVAEDRLNEIYKMPPTNNSSQGMTVWAYNDSLEKKSPVVYKNNNVIIFKANEDLLRYIVLQDGNPVLYIGLSKFLDGYKSGTVATEMAGRGKGLAQQSYLNASDILGAPIYSDSTQTDASRLGIWDKLIQQYPDRIVGYDQKTNKNLPLSMTDKGPTVNQNQPIYVDRNKKDSSKPLAPNQRYRTRILKLLPSKKQGVEEGLDQDVPPVLYHATYKPRLKNIKLKGLGAGGKRNWEDSQRGVVYLALDPNVAESYAETSDMVSDEWLDQIVILKISTAGLDPNKFQIDSNVQDNEGDTVEYHGVIPPSNISLYKQGVAEGCNKISEDLSNYNGLNIDYEFSPDELTLYVSAISGDGETKLGSVEFEFNGEAWVANELVVDEHYRKQGIASTMYDFVKEHLGKKIIPSHSQTDAGRAFWKNKQVWEDEQGVAEDEHASTPRPRVVDSMKSMVDVGGIQLNVAIDGAEVSIRPVVDGYQAGYVVFDRDGRTLVPDDLAIDDEVRGRGIAKIIYDYVKSLGFTIRRSSDQTRAGKHFWDKNRGEDGMIWEAGLIQQLVDIKNGPWILYESNRRVEIRKSHLFNQTLEDKAEKTPHLVAKIKEFVRFKSENPSRIIGKDTPLTNSPMAKTVPNIRHYHLTQDLSLFYTISGHDPVIIKLFGVFNHHESGTGDTRNINRQRSLAKQLGNQFDSADQPVAESSDDIESLDLMSAFKDFLPVAMRELDIKKLPPIKLLKQIPAGDQPTFGKFNKQDNVIHLGISERHPVDILRTLAHELVHYKQNTEHQLAVGSGATGGPEENQAHEVAGIIMRDFNKLHPEYFKSQAVNLSEGVEHDKETLDEILVNLCRHVVEGQRVDPNKYGMVAACVIDPDNRQVIGVNELTQDGTRRHGERVAMERYQAQYGAIPEGSIIVTTCSPCNEEHMTERYGESCTDLINSSNCQKVYCGFQDPSQQDEHNEFELEVTGNSSIVDLCGQFAATFLNENFNDGKNPGRKGLSQRVGIPKNATIAQLERYKDAPGEKGRMARWQLNMRRGRNK